MNALALALALVVSAAEAPSDATLETLRATYVEEERALLASRVERGRAVENLRRLDARGRELAAKLAAVTAARAAAEVSLLAARERLAFLEDQLTAHRRSAGLRLAAVSRQTAARPLELLLTAKDPADFVYRYLALRELAKAEAALIARLRAAAVEADAARVLLDTQVQAAAALESAARSELLRAEALVTLQREQVKILSEEAEERRLWMEEIRTQARDLGVMISRLPSSRAPAAKPGAADPVAGALVARFGEADPDAGNYLPANGRRYAAPAGTPVRVVAAGLVVYADWFQGFGRLVIVDHGGGFNSLYAHLDEIRAAAGAAVLAGDELGTAGSSGSIAEPGLYFEVRKGGKPIDPAKWLAQIERPPQVR